MNEVPLQKRRNIFDVRDGAVEIIDAGKKRRDIVAESASFNQQEKYTLSSCNGYYKVSRSFYPHSVLSGISIHRIIRISTTIIL